MVGKQSDPVPRTRLGEKLVELRATVHLSQRDLADLSTVTQGTIRNIESGGKHPTPATLKLLAAGLTHSGLLDTKRVHRALIAADYMDRVGLSLPAPDAPPDHTIPQIDGPSGVSVEFRQWDAKYKKKPPEIREIIRIFMNSVLNETESSA